MPRYYFVAQNKEKAVSRGELESRGREEALDSLLKRGLSPMKLEEIAYGGNVGTRRRFNLNILGGDLTTLDQVIIIRQLGTILNAGTDLLSGLDIIAQDSLKPFVKRVMYDLKERVMRGETLSGALAAWKNNFNPIFISLVKAGEASGNLPDILLTYSQELRKDYTFMRRIKGALVYPVILVFALGGMIILILSVVAPRIKELFTSLKAEPPWYTRLFFFASDLWLQYTYVFIVLITMVIVVAIVSLKNKKIQRKMTALLWHFPFLNKVQKDLTLMRFAKTIASLLKAGFSLKPALKVASDVTNPAYETAITDIADRKLEEGVSMANALKEYPRLFPGLFVSVIATGEKSGNLSAVLVQLAEFYEEEVLYSLEVLMTLIEPVLLIIVGVIVGLLASSLIAPIYRLIGNIH